MAVSPRRGTSNEEHIRSRRAGRRLALAAVFEAEFGQRTADAILERHLATEGDPETAALARELVKSFVAAEFQHEDRFLRRVGKIDKLEAEG